MAFRLAFFGVVVGLVSCSHFARKPAQIEEPATSCAQSFREFPQEQLRNITSATDEMYGLFGYLRGAYAKDVEAALQTKTASCELEDRLNDLRVDLELKRDEISRQANGLKQMGQFFSMYKQPVFSDPLAVDKVFCLEDCAGHDREREKMLACARNCKAQPDRTLNDLLQTYDHCASGTAQDKESFRLAYSRDMLGFMHVARDTEPEFLKLQAEAILMNSQLEKLNQRLTLFTKSHPKPRSACVHTAPQLPSVVAKAVSYTKVDRFGTSFFVNDGRQRNMITAGHLFGGAKFEDSTIQGITAVEMQKDPGARKAEEHPFQVRPGLVDFSNDIIRAAAEGEGPVLEVAEKNVLPDPSATYYIVGFPASAPGFQIYPCQFKGIKIDSVDGDKPSYILSCHGMTGPIQGMSGGPMLDQSGKVWGVISAEINLWGRIQIRPLSKDREGKLVMGIQDPLNTDYCVAKDFTGFRRCQIVSGPNN